MWSFKERTSFGHLKRRSLFEMHLIILTKKTKGSQILNLYLYLILFLSFLAFYLYINIRQLKHRNFIWTAFNNVLMKKKKKKKE